MRTTFNNKEIGRIGVLMGGPSSEREISLKSGNGIIDGLLKRGCEVFSVEIHSDQETDNVQLLEKAGIDIAFIALHGTFGEDGQMQAILERVGIPYTGSGVKASRLAMNKILTQDLVQKHGVRIPHHMVINKDEDADPQRIVDFFHGHPVVVKPQSEGSSIGISIVYEMDQLKDAMALAFQYGQKILIEEYIKGKEVTVGILANEVLPVVEIRPKNKFFDFTAKYQKGMTDYIVPAEMTARETSDVQSQALEAYRALGCRDFARMDFILDRKGTSFFLEANTIPGFTPTSLLPMAAKKAGYDFPDLCLRIVQLAARRKS